MRRFFEILPGALAWLTLILMVVFSRMLPAVVSVFIIIFDLYWLLKTIYLSLHLRSTFRAMNENLKVAWFEKLRASQGALPWEDIIHLVILPVFDEPYAVVRESFETLYKTKYPKEKLIVVLAIEERAGITALQMARRIETEFENKFFRFFITVHPEGLPGEIPGKGSNESWAVQKVKEGCLDPLGIPYENILVSAFDVDTQVYPEYFGRLTYVFLNASNRLHAIYQPIPLFTNNIYHAPALARVTAFSASFWQMMQQSRSERLTTFSSQSIPFPALLDIGFWHKDIVSEDSRIFWQCYLRYHGDFRVEPLFYPVAMDAIVGLTLWQSLKNLYRQQRRWGWGVENIPYVFDGFRRDSQISRRQKWYWRLNIVDGFHSWATNSLMIFALGWLPVVLGGRAFNYTLLSYNLPKITRFIISLSMVGIASSAILSLLLLSPKPEWFRVRHYFLYILQWLLLPITLIVFGAFPALEAQTRLAFGGKWRLGFWVTPKSRESRI